MSRLPYPDDLIIEIIHNFAVIEAERTEWLRLRLVNSTSNNRASSILAFYHDN